MTDYSRELNKGLKVFSQLYVGLKPQGEGTVDLGFATPFENNAAFRKRKTTVDSWADWTEYVIDPENPGRYKVDANGRAVIVKHPANTKVVDNVPREGFKITDSLKRVYWGGGNVVWRIEDPLGFELEIQSNNLLAIIQNCDISTGIIKGKCLWARDGKDNILIHESSEEYKNAFKFAENLKAPATVPMADRVVGGKYLLKNGTEAIYVGRMYAYIPQTQHADKIYNDYYSQKSTEEYAQFVNIPGIKFKRLIFSGSRGAGTIIAEKCYFGGTVEQFDVVVNDSLNGFTFYAKSGAPLVRRLDDSITEVPKQIQRLTNDTKLVFAGTRKDTILYAQVEKFSSVEFGTRAPTEAEKQILLRKLDQIGVEYSKSYRSDADNFYWGIMDISNVGDGFEFGWTQYQNMMFAKIDTRFATYEGPQLLLLKSRITPTKLCVSAMQGLTTFEHSNYAIGKSGPITHEQAGIDLIDATPPSSVAEAVTVAKERVNTNMTYIIDYITRD